MALQLTIFDNKQIIETVIVTPTKEMPLEAYKYFHRFSTYSESMDRTIEGYVIWDADLSIIYCEDMAEAEWLGLQNDWFSISLEIPKDFINE